ncbi:MAG: FAD-binding oxidoreductase [Alphaproteobacteria bacterium]|nr:FAD-binding oxidoreductase [Alphaproteobacteria bacterium]
MSIAPTIAARLKEIAGPHGFSEDPAEIAPHLEEWRSKYHGHTTLLLKPSHTEQVSKILALCNESNTAIVPQGGNTGLVGGQIPFHGEVLLSLARMNKIRAVDAHGMSLIAEAGVILADIQRAAEDAGRYFPLSLAAEGSCTIGGNLSTNAGGVNVLRYGNARELVLGLEVVLADGRVLDLLRALRKDNTGYDLKQLFIGAEGTLGIITAAALKLFPAPGIRTTAFAAIADPAAAVTLLSHLQDETGGLISAFELIPRIGLEFVLAHMPQTTDPLSAPSPWYVLTEAAGPRGMDMHGVIEASLAAAMDAGLVRDAAIAQNETQRAQFWRLRESLSESQKPEGGSIKHDVSLPIARIPEFLARASAAVIAKVPGARPVPFGHIGDGNIHFNISVPKGGDNAAFLAQWETVNRIVHDIVREFGGSISAEHGLGVMKHNEIARYKSADEIAVMNALKRTLDPKNILNPGKVLPDSN